MEKKPLQTWSHFIISDNIEHPRESSHLKQEQCHLHLGKNWSYLVIWRQCRAEPVQDHLLKHSWHIIDTQLLCHKETCDKLK